MIKAVKVTNYIGESLTMELANPEKSGLAIYNIEGIGGAQSNVSTTEIVTMDGGLYNSARKQQRNIVLYIYLGYDDSELARQKTYRYFPVKHEVTLTFYTDKRTMKITGYVESNEPAIFTSETYTQISIVCPDPNFYSVNEEDGVLCVFNGTDPNFEFPWSNEGLEAAIEFGTITTDTRKSVYYTGEANNGMNIVIESLGDANNITIYNLRTRESMFIDSAKLTALTGHNIMAGDRITISTFRGNKSATLLRGGVETNILNCLGRDTCWFELVRGDNLFGYDAEDGLELLHFKIESTQIYEGV